MKDLLKKKVKVGISVGDLNGIGMEIIIKTFIDKRMMDICTPIVFGSSKTSFSSLSIILLSVFVKFGIDQPIHCG